ncbi:MAG TPA: SurA N-terminal domain-containing protein, partial [Gammaproteobacteria bacterium]|nr:SurA N-terminal domain-containing protein [Gammaproteobacteria bacterium]
MIFKLLMSFNAMLPSAGVNPKTFLTACLIGILLISGNVMAGVPLDRIVAVINDDVIMQSELEERIRSVLKQMAQQGAELPPQDILIKQVLERMIMVKLQTQFAERTGIKVDDETLNQTINRIAAENNLSLSQFRNILEKDGINYENFREDIRNEITITQLKRRQVDNRVTVTDREIDNFLANE